MPERWNSPEGYPVDTLYGYARFLFKFLDQVRPERISAAFDESLGSCFRNDIYPDYKVSRAHPDEALAFQLSACKSLTEIMGVQSLASERYEADDIIASHASRAQARGEAVCIVTRDKDLGQLLKNDADSCWDFAADRKVTTADFLAYFGVEPWQVADYLALVGDPADDIPGVPGIGKKTAAALLAQFASIDGLYADLTALASCGVRGASGLPDKLQCYREQVAMARRLTLLERTVTVLDSDTALQWAAPSKTELAAFFAAFGLEQALAQQLNQYDWLVD